MTVITKRLLELLNACKEGISFFENNFPEELFPDGLNLEEIEVTGDYKCYFRYISNLPEIVFDDRGNCIRKIEPNGNIYQYEYDSKGNKIKYKDTSGYIYQYKYDDRGNMIKKIGPDGDIYQYEYDNNNNLIKEIYPDGSVYREIVKYDSIGRLIRVQDCFIEYC